MVWQVVWMGTFIAGLVLAAIMDALTKTIKNQLILVWASLIAVESLILALRPHSTWSWMPHVWGLVIVFGLLLMGYAMGQVGAGDTRFGAIWGWVIGWPHLLSPMLLISVVSLGLFGVVVIRALAQHRPWRTVSIPWAVVVAVGTLWYFSSWW